MRGIALTVMIKDHEILLRMSERARIINLSSSSVNLGLGPFIREKRERERSPAREHGTPILAGRENH